MNDREHMQTMVSRLAHEIRNPLATIKSGIQLFLRFTSEPEDLTKYLVDAVVATDRIDAAIVRMRLLLSLVPRTSSIFPVSRLMDSLERQFPEEPRLSFPTNDDHRAPKVFVNFDQIMLALTELVTNALLYSSDTVEVSWAAEGQRTVALHVRDRGPGPPKEIETRLFEPFVAGPHRGIGLGLAIVARVCELNEARATVGAREGGGSELTISLPRV
ncbi:MAG TPA: HAMP domain-containing histidine kinase [Acidobacteria bacterium]|nr:HAMP domain-containing histidine kinase [Acidobacteriota bacterium]